MKRGVVAALTCVGLWFVWASPGAAQAGAGIIILKRIVTDAPKVTRIALGDAGRMYVLTPDDHAVSVHDLSGGAIGRVGLVGNGPGELLNPVDLTAAPGGAVWVVDKGNNRLQRFDRDGRVNAQVSIPSPLSVAVGPGGGLWVVAAFDRPLVRVFDQAGSQTREVGEPVRVSGMPAEQEAYLSRGRVFSFDGGLLYMFRGLAKPKLLKIDLKGQVVQEIAVESPALDGARQRATQMEEDMRKNGGFRYSGTLNGLAVESGRGIIWVCPSAPLLLAYDLATGSKLAEFEMRLDDAAGGKVALQDLVVRGKVGFGVVAKRGVVRFDLPPLPKGRS